MCVPCFGDRFQHNTWCASTGYDSQSIMLVHNRECESFPFPWEIGSAVPSHISPFIVHTQLAEYGAQLKNYAPTSRFPLRLPSESPSSVLAPVPGMSHMKFHILHFQLFLPILTWSSGASPSITSTPSKVRECVGAWCSVSYYSRASSIFIMATIYYSSTAVQMFRKCCYCQPYGD